MTWETAPGAITADALRKAFEQVKAMPPHPCQLGQHVVSARALTEDGWYTCGNCMAPVRVVGGRYA